MKKIFLFAVMAFAFSSIVQAQEIADHAIGLRFGSNDGLGTEISYQKGLSDTNRLEVDLGWRSSNDYNLIKLTGLYQWVMPLEGDFNWFAGAGGGLLSWKFDNNIVNSTSGTALYVAGNAGIEYHFDFPLMLALDIRPELGFGNDYYDGLELELGFSARYKF